MLRTWPVESDAPLRRARMSPERCSILTTLTGISSLLTYCSSGRFRKSEPVRNRHKGEEEEIGGEEGGGCEGVEEDEVEEKWRRMEEVARRKGNMEEG